MEFKWTRAFDYIKAEDTIKDKTYLFLSDRIHKKYKKPAYSSLTLVVTSLLFMVFLSVSGYSLYFTETSFISVDINPSLELGLNRFDRVITVTAFNEDGGDIAAFLSLKNKPYSEAIDSILRSDIIDSYVVADSMISLTVLANNTKKEKVLLEKLKSYEEQTDIPVECHTANSNLHTQAHNHGMSMGKYITYEELQALDPTITIDSCKDLSMGELRRLIEDCHNQKDTKQKEETCKRGHNHDEDKREH